MEEPFQADRYYSLAHIASVFDVHPCTVRREVQRTPELLAAVVEKFGSQYLPGAVLAAWVKQPARPAGRVRSARGVFVPIAARTPGELQRKLEERSKRSEVALG